MSYSLWTWLATIEEKQTKQYKKYTKRKIFRVDQAENGKKPKIRNIFILECEQDIFMIHM